MASRGGPRDPKGEPNGGKMGVKIASKIVIDFQAIFDAKIVRQLLKHRSENNRISSPVIANIGYNREVMSPRPTCIWTRKTRVQMHFRRMLVISSYLQNHWKIDEKSVPKTNESTTSSRPRFLSKNRAKKGRKSSQIRAKIEEKRVPICSEM